MSKKIYKLFIILNFFRLVPYFNGIYNLESVVYNEQISSSDLYILVDKFKDLLFVSSYEDPNPLIRINIRI